jgi:hypothetical protein
MTVAIEAIPSEDSSLFTYLVFEYDKELFSDVHENLTQITKDGKLTFNLESNFFTIVRGAYHTLKRKLSITSIEKNKFSNSVMSLKTSQNIFPLEYCQLHIESNYFYFTAHTFKSQKKVEYQSINFDRTFIENLQKNCV